MADRSPFRLDFEQQRKRAKDLLAALRAGTPEAFARLRMFHPAAGVRPMADATPALGLADAQLVIAREIGLPSWPRLKAHIAALSEARAQIAAGSASPDGGAATLHIRCGTDLRQNLREAGFSGAFLAYDDALCQGPVTPGDDWVDRRAAFLAGAYAAPPGRDAARIESDLRQAEAGLHAAAGDYARVVIWVEHDSYDQLVLARCLACFAATPPRCLELVSVAQFPGNARFIGLGQLPPEALRLLWRRRRPVSAAQCAIGARIWAALRAADPGALAGLAGAKLAGLAHMGPALRRHCQELPWREDGLGLTERLVLQLLDEGPKSASDLFTALMREREPLPWLGDVMLLHILSGMRAAREPVFVGALPQGWGRWPDTKLSLTAMGRAVLAGEVDYLSLVPPERWLGGVRIGPERPCWRWDDGRGVPVPC